MLKLPPNERLALSTEVFWSCSSTPNRSPPFSWLTTLVTTTFCNVMGNVEKANMKPACGRSGDPSGMGTFTGYPLITTVPLVSWDPKGKELEMAKNPKLADC